MTRPRYSVTSCVLVRRDDRWLLSVRAPDIDYLPGSIGLIGGHVELSDSTEGVLESTARRELWEETGVDLAEVPLTYVSSTLFLIGQDDQHVSVTFVAEAPPGARPEVRSDELSEVGWWSVEELRSDPRTPPWLPALLTEVPPRRTDDR